jgi:enoyl-CoA hydratase/carnithine racemase
VVTENRDKVTLIGINRPQKRNCVNKETAQQLLNAFEKFENDTNSVIAVLHGIGGTFCAGYDLKELSSANSQNIDLNEFIIRGPMV